MYYQGLLTHKNTYLYLHLVVLSRAPNLQHISLQPHSVCSHLNYLTLLTDDLVPKNKTKQNKKKLKKYIPLIHAIVNFTFHDNLGEHKLLIQTHQTSLSKIKAKATTSI